MRSFLKCAGIVSATSLLLLSQGCSQIQPKPEVAEQHLITNEVLGDSLLPSQVESIIYDESINIDAILSIDYFIDEEQVTEEFTAEEDEALSLKIYAEELNIATKMVEEMFASLDSDVLGAFFSDMEEEVLSIDEMDEALSNLDETIHSNNIWARIRSGFSISHVEHPRIKGDLRWYARHQDYLDRVATRAAPYLHFIVDEAEKRNMPLEIALLPIVESAFHPFAYSHGRAAGIWQFIPGTGRSYGMKQNWWYDGRRDIYLSTIGALKYLQNLQKSFNGDWQLALAAYNSGAGTVRKAIRKNKRRGRPTDFWSLSLPKETRGYVPKLLAISKIVANPEKYGITLKHIADQPFFERVDIGSQIDLALAAELADVSLDEIYRLNPGFNRWATPPKGPHHLLLPLDKVELFKEQIAALPNKQRVKWKRHKVRSGENLLTIAKKYQTTVPLLKEVNKLRGSVIQIGQGLTIPVATKSLNAYTLSEGQRKRATQNTQRNGRTKITHTVRSGDTIWGISRKYDVGVRSLAKWNGMAPRDKINIGQKLAVWVKRGSNRSAMNVPQLDGLTQKINYVVRRGDSLARISQKFRVSINQLKKWNRRLKAKKYLQPGQRLTLYVDVTQQSS